MIEKVNSFDESAMKTEFEQFSRYIDELASFEDDTQEDVSMLQTEFNVFNSRKKEFIRIIEKGTEESNERERNSLAIISDIKDRYEKNLLKLKNHYENQLSLVMEKHKYSVSKWKTIYEALKNSSNNANLRIDNTTFDKKFYETKVDKLSKELEELKSKNVNLEVESKKLKKENTSYEQQVKKLQSEVSTLEKNIDKKNDELDKLKVKSKEAEANNKKNLENIKSLKDQLNSKEKSSKAQEVKSEIENVENEIRSKACYKSRTHSDSKSLEEDLENYKVDVTLLKVDLRTATRELEKKTVYCDYLRNELAEVKGKLHDTEEKLKEMEEKNRRYSKSIESYKKEVGQFESRFSDRNRELTELKHTLDENTKSLDLKIKEITDSKLTESKWKTKSTEFEKKNQMLLNEIETIKRKNAALKVDIEKKVAEIEMITTEKNRIQKSHQTLKQVSKQLEEQLKAFTDRYTEVSTVKKTLIQQKSSISTEIDCLKQQLSDANEKIELLRKEKEEAFVEKCSAEMEFKNSLSEQKIQFNKLSREFDIEREKCQQLEERIEWYEENLNECQMEISKLDRDLVLIKEEAANHITIITALRSEKEQLMEELGSKIQFENTLLEKIEYLKNEFDMKEDEMKRDRAAISETLSQHKKLIDFISSKQLGQKKSLLFGFGSNKQNHQQKLDNEIVKNNQLNAKLKETQEELGNYIIEVKSLQGELMELKNMMSQLPLNKKKELLSIDSPHRFTSIMVKTPTTCVSCAKSIFIGQKAKKCQDCNSKVHHSCSLVNNCCMPVNYVRDTVIDSLKSDSKLFHADLESAEPSAPEDNSDSSQTTEMIMNDLVANYNDKFSFTDSLNEILKTA